MKKNHTANIFFLISCVEELDQSLQQVICDWTVRSVTCVGGGSVTTISFLSLELIGFSAGIRKAQKQKEQALLI